MGLYAQQYTVFSRIAGISLVSLKLHQGIHLSDMGPVYKSQLLYGQTGMDPVTGSPMGLLGILIKD